MPNYTGCPCKVCQNIFKAEDDIVVCPECGTPYHRSCYTAKGTCINTELHASGMSWQEVHRSKLTDRVCPNCSHINAPDAAACSICHTPLKEDPSGEPGINVVMPDGRTMSFRPDDPCCGLSPNEEFDGETLGDIASYVKRNTLYYIPLFKRFKDTGKKISVNFPCLLFPHLYFASRKMWLMTFLTIAVLALCNIPAMLTSMLAAFTDKTLIEMYAEYGMDVPQLFGNLTAFIENNEPLIQTLDFVFYGIQLAFRVILCIFANHIYYRHTLKKVKKLRTSNVSPQMRRILLQSDGGVNFLNIFGALALYYGAVMAVMMVIMALFM